MKLWSIPSSLLDDGRLLRLHQSIHGVLLEILKPSTKRTRNKFYNYGGYLVLRHWEAVNEMRLRGMNHSSYVDVLWKRIPITRRQILYKYDKDMILKDMKILKIKQRKSCLSTGTSGRVPITFLSNELNRLSERYNREGLPLDIFLI